MAAGTRLIEVGGHGTCFYAGMAKLFLILSAAVIALSDPAFGAGKKKTDFNPDAYLSGIEVPQSDMPQGFVAEEASPPKISPQEMALWSVMIDLDLARAKIRHLESELEISRATAKSCPFPINSSIHCSSYTIGTNQYTDCN